MLQLALYKGPATDTWHQLAHRVICWVTGSPYSHVELVINGVCCSASPRDGGVRFKRIDLASGKWDVIDVPGHSEARAWDWFCRHNGHAYDYAGPAAATSGFAAKPWPPRWACRLPTCGRQVCWLTISKEPTRE
jgi:hypothetical protein